MSGLPGLSPELKDLAAGYVLEELDASEVQHLERVLRDNPQLRQEVRQLQAVLGLMAADVPAMPPPLSLRDRTLSAFAEDFRQEYALSAPLTATQPPSTNQRPQSPDQRVQALTAPQGIPWAKLLAGLGLLLASGLAWDNFQLRRQLSFAQQPAPEAIAQLLQRPKSRLATLTANPANPTNAAGGMLGGTLLFTPGQWQEVVLSLQDLPPLESDQVYRLWLTLANDQTIFCGEFRTNPQGKVSVKMNPPQQPPQGVKATGLVVTRDRIGSALQLRGDRMLTGTI